MKDTVTITRHEMAKKCSDALNEVFADDEKMSRQFINFLFFAGLITAKVFEDEEQGNE